MGEMEVDFFNMMVIHGKDTDASTPLHSSAHKVVISSLDPAFKKLPLSGPPFPATVPQRVRLERSGPPGYFVRYLRGWGLNTHSNVAVNLTSLLARPPAELDRSPTTLRPSALGRSDDTKDFGPRAELLGCWTTPAWKRWEVGLGGLSTSPSSPSSATLLHGYLHWPGQFELFENSVYATYSWQNIRWFD